MLFISYCHEDMTLFHEVERVLKQLSNIIGVKVWSDKLMMSGDWKKQLRDSMEKSRAAVLLLFPGYINSEACMLFEQGYLSNLETTRGLKIFPFLIRPCLFQVFPWIGNKDRQIFLPNGKSLAEHEGVEREIALNEFAAKIHAELRGGASASGRWNALLPGKTMCI